MTRDIVLTNARVVLPDAVFSGTVVVRDGTIVDISEGTTARGDDLDGNYLLPGIVELHTDHLEAHFMPRPGTRWDPIPAVLAHDVQLSGAGVTTVFDAIRIGSMEGSPGADPDAALIGQELVDAINQADQAGITRAQHFIHLRCEVAAPVAVEEFTTFSSQPAVRLASVMDHTPGQRQYADPEAFRRYMVGKGLLSEQDIEAQMDQLREIAAQHSAANRRAIAGLAAARGITLAAHDDATIEHVEESASFGARISEFPTTETAARAARDKGQLIVMGAPNIVRGGSQSGNVSGATLLKLGLVDVLSSDYVPASPLQAIFQLTTEGILDIAQATKLVSTSPAHAVGLYDRGQIAIGKRADLVQVHLHELPATERHPQGRQVPVARAVYRQGARVS
jgi:alpha-D-ribose 1-methylphosphonate 5-triphosphate diphosphatase